MNLSFEVINKYLKKIVVNKFFRIGLICLVILCLVTPVIFLLSLSKKPAAGPKIILARSIPTPTISFTPTPTLTATPTPSPTPAPAPKTLKILFGIGSQAGPEMDDRIVHEAPIHMLTSWYNGPSDLEWMSVQKNDLIPRLYQAGYVVHLITWTDLPEEDITTPYGPACGRPYPVSTQVVDDMRQLAQIYNGNGPMYVSLFTEFPTYTCTDNNWVGNENYYRTLKDNFIKIKDIFHQYAPYSKVGISFGGWLSRYDNVEEQGGRSLIPHFVDVIQQSDFVAFQSMESDSNVEDILTMTQLLGQYGKPVMIAHYKPSNGSTEVFDNDIKTIFSDSVMQQLINNGLFAFSFMDNEMIDKSDTSYQLVKSAISKYSR